MAKQSKCDLVEFDIHITSDGVPVLIHDESTGRTSKEDVMVKDTRVKDIKSIPLKVVSGIKAGIPTLVEAVEWCEQNNMRMILDIKTADEKMLAYVTKIIKSKNLYSKAIISSFNPFVAFMVKKIDKNILTGFTSRSSYYTYDDADRKLIRNNPPFMYIDSIIDDLIDLGIRTFVLPEFLGVDMLLLHHRNINSYLVDDARKRDIHVIAWTVNDPYQASFLRLINVPFLTDYPQLLKEKQ